MVIVDFLGDLGIGSLMSEELNAGVDVEDSERQMKSGQDFLLKFLDCIQLPLPSSSRPQYLFSSQLHSFSHIS